MGYSYDQSGRLACDVCGRAEGTTRRRKCPHGWCPAVAACPGCFKTLKADGRWSERHTTCAASSAAYAAKEARRAAIIEAGGFVRTSAMGFNGDTGELVRVVFTGKDQAEIGFNMTQEAYHSIPLLEPATPDDFRANGFTLTDAPASYNDLYGRKGLPTPRALGSGLFAARGDDQRTG